MNYPIVLNQYDGKEYDTTIDRYFFNDKCIMEIFNAAVAVSKGERVYIRGTFYVVKDICTYLENCVSHVFLETDKERA